MDVEQNYINKEMLKLQPDIMKSGKWPSEYDQAQVVVFESNTKKYLSLCFNIWQVSLVHVIHANEKLVLAYSTKTETLHSVCVEKFENGKFYCINSHGKSNPFPVVDPWNTSECHLFQVTTSVEIVNHLQYFAMKIEHLCKKITKMFSECFWFSN